jgi:hypothetical protein
LTASPYERRLIPFTVRSIAALHATDSRRCLLERYQQRRREGRDSRESNAEDLTSLGSLCLERLPDDELSYPIGLGSPFFA